MIRYTPVKEWKKQLFKTPFEQELSAENRWVKMAELIPWDEMAQVFFAGLSKNHGRPTVDLRVILGALMVKHIENLSDEATIEYIQENIYAQYFVGLRGFQSEPVFVPSLFVEIRKRLGEAGSRQLNDLMIAHARKLKVIRHRRKPSDGAAGAEAASSEQDDHSGGEDQVEQSEKVEVKEEQAEQESSSRNRGTLLLDATVAPLHIAYPTDTRLLNHARQQSEELIDQLYSSQKKLWPTKPRTYRKEARQAFVSFSKKKRKDKKAIRKATGQQLRYLKRNVYTLDKMLDLLEEKGLPIPWKHQHWRQLWIIRELYRQQAEMFADRRRQVSDRIVSLQQPHARPIKRGKGGGKDTEFGPKINVSMSDGIARVDQIDFNAFNESNYLQEQVKGYKARFGYYPALVLADQIYWTRENRNFLKQRNIRHSGLPLGKQAKQSRHEKYKRRKISNERSKIEGKFGQAKLKYGLDNLYTRLPKTTIVEINLIFLVINALKVALEVIKSSALYLSTGYKALGNRLNQQMIKLMNQLDLYGRRDTKSALATAGGATF